MKNSKYRLLIVLIALVVTSLLNQKAMIITEVPTLEKVVQDAPIPQEIASKHLEYVPINHISQTTEDKQITEKSLAILNTAMASKQIDLEKDNQVNELIETNKIHIPDKPTLINSINLSDTFKLQVIDAGIKLVDEPLYSCKNTYFVADIIVKNISKERQIFTPYHFTLINQKNNAQIAYEAPLLTTEDNLLENVTLLPSATLKGSLYFKVVGDKNTYTLKYLNTITKECFLIDCTKVNDSKVTQIATTMQYYPETATYKDSIDIHGLNVKINNIFTTPPHSPFEKLPPNKQYMVINLTIKNNSLNSQYISRNLFNLLQQDGILQNTDVLIKSDYDNFKALDLAPQESITGNLIYIYDTSQIAWLVFQPSLIDNDVSAVIKLTTNYKP